MLQDKQAARIQWECMHRAHGSMHGQGAQKCSRGQIQGAFPASYRLEIDQEDAAVSVVNKRRVNSRAGRVVGADINLISSAERMHGVAQG